MDHQKWSRTKKTSEKITRSDTAHRSNTSRQHHTTHVLSFVSRLHPVAWFFIGIAFLLLSALGSLFLHVKMDQNSFKMATIQTNIGVLTQNVQDDQTILDKDQYDLPNKAQRLGMVLGSNAITINLSKPVGTPVNKGATNVLEPNQT
ncbi:MAG: hypothetical protein IKG43_01180 [Aeriscardovia sp.]|nr:hypothetical protein [Aeriscardovia sp.]